MTQRIRTVRDETGVALPLALFALVMLAGLLLAFLSMAGTEPGIAQNHASSTRALYVADAGIEHAWAVLPGTDVPAVIKAQGGKLFNAQAFGGGSYSVTVAQNPDGTYLLTSTGTFTNGSRTIRALVSAGNLPPPARGSAETLVGGACAPVGQPNCTEFDAEPGGVFDGRDWTAPVDMTACTDIASCGTKISDTGTFGGFANTKDNLVQISKGGFIGGTGVPGCPSPCTGTTPATASVQKDTTVPLTRWDSFIDGATLKATRTVAVSSALSGTYTWGTAAAPEITVIDHTGPNFNWNADVNGAGVLIIETPGVGPPKGKDFTEVEIRGKGALNWEGLVIIRSPGRVSFEIGGSGSKGDKEVARIFGQVVNRSALYAEIEFENNVSFVKYSSAAMKMVQGQFSPSFKGWQEVTP
jgi:hypothetical protein